jgi:hypothetical protein
VQVRQEVAITAERELMFQHLLVLAVHYLKVVAVVAVGQAQAVRQLVVLAVQPVLKEQQQQLTRVQVVAVVEAALPILLAVQAVAALFILGSRFNYGRTILRTN